MGLSDVSLLTSCKTLRIVGTAIVVIIMHNLCQIFMTAKFSNSNSRDRVAILQEKKRKESVKSRKRTF